MQKCWYFVTFFVLFIIINNKNMILILFNIFLLNYINTVYHVHELIMVYELQTKTVNTTHLFMRTIYKMYIEPLSMILTKYIHFLMTVYTTHIHVLVNSNEYTFSWICASYWKRFKISKSILQCQFEFPIHL